MMEPQLESVTNTPPEPAHPSLRVLCEARRDELHEILRRLPADGSPNTRRDIELALDAIDGLLTGNLDQIPPVVAEQLSRWIASSKYLGAKETRALAEEAGAAPPSS